MSWLIPSIIISGIGDGISIQDTDFKILYQNQALKDLIGDHVGEYCYKAYEHNEDVCEGCPVADSFKDGRVHKAERAGIVDGSILKIEIAASPMRDSSGRIIAGIEVVRDITERKLVEEAIIRERNIRDAALNCAGDGVILADTEGRILLISRALERLTGYTTDELIGRKPPFPFWPSDQLDRIMAAFREALFEKKAGSRQYEFVYQRKNGERFNVIISPSPVYDESGQFIGMMSILRDTTSQKQTEKALMESEERFRQIFEQNEDALMILKSVTCEIVDANSAAENLYGYKREELIGHNPLLFMEYSEYEDLKQAIRSKDVTSGFHIEQITNIKKDRTKVIVSIRGKSIGLREEKFVYCSFRDITERIRAKEESRLVQAKLIQANKMSSLGILVSSIAHEINNPNNFIMFNAPLLSEAWEDAFKVLTGYYRENGDFSIGGLPFSEMREVIPKLISGIAEGSSRINDIVGNLKDFARQDRAGMDSEVDVNKAIKSSVAILKSQIRKYTENFHMDLDENLPSLRGSARQLEQVIINLIINALQALPDKKHCVRVSTSFNNELRHVIIEIKDEGIGMTKEVLEKIREPFFSTKLDSGGTGLGLFISRSIIKEHKGSLELKSGHGKGTTVVIKLPLLGDYELF